MVEDPLASAARALVGAISTSLSGLAFSGTGLLMGVEMGWQVLNIAYQHGGWVLLVVAAVVVVVVIVMMNRSRQ